METFTTADLLEGIKLRSLVPTSQSTYTTTRFLKLATETMRDFLMPYILGFRERYYVYDHDFTVVSSGVYNIPSRAVGASIENMALVNGDARKDLAWFIEDELTDYGASRNKTPGVWLGADQAFMVPRDGFGWPTFRMTIHLRPGKFVETSACGQVTDVTGGVVTVSNFPSTFLVTAQYDFVQQNPHFKTLAIEKTPTAVDSGAGTLTFDAADVPSRLAVGDWVCLTGETCIIQAPTELHSMLQQKTANLVLTGVNRKALAEGEKELKRLIKDVKTLINPRITKEGKKLKLRSGLLRRSI